MRDTTHRRRRGDAKGQVYSMNSYDNSDNSDTNDTSNTRIKSPGRRAMRDALKARQVVIVPGHICCVDAGGAYMIPARGAQPARYETGEVETQTVATEDGQAIWKRSRLSGEARDGAPHPGGNRAHRRAMLAKGRTAQRRVSRGRERLRASVVVARAR